MIDGVLGCLYPTKGYNKHRGCYLSWDEPNFGSTICDVVSVMEDEIAKETYFIRMRGWCEYAFELSTQPHNRHKGFDNMEVRSC